MPSKVLLICLIIYARASGQEAWPPPELEGAWKLHRIEISRNGIQEEILQNQATPKYCLFVDDYHFWFDDHVVNYAMGAKLKFHEKKEDQYYLFWKVFGNTRIFIRKEGEQTLRMNTESLSRDFSKIRAVYRMERVDKQKAVQWIKAVLNDEPRLGDLIYRDDSKNVLEKFLTIQD